MSAGIGMYGASYPIAVIAGETGVMEERSKYLPGKDAVTLLDINNSVPADMYAAEIGGTFDYTHKDTFRPSTAATPHPANWHPAR